MERSVSYPSFKSIRDLREEAHKINSYNNEINTENNDIILKFKEKDHERTERLARSGSNSSFDITQEVNCCHNCCRSFCRLCFRLMNYIFESETEAKRMNDILHYKSYASIYYFIKWFTRSLFFLFFTTLGTIAGKELGCVIKDNDKCKTGVLELADSSPHIIAYLIGSVFGLLVGQWLGRLIWDNLFNRINLDSIRQVWLYVISILVYISVTSCFALIFLLFIDMGNSEVIGSIIGGIIGFLCAIVALAKKFCSN